MPHNTLLMFLKLKILLEWLINSIKLKKVNTIQIFVNHLVQVLAEIIIGQIKLKTDQLLLVSHHKGCLMPKIFCMLKMELKKKVKLYHKCIEKLMVTTLQVSKNKEITIGNLIRQIIYLVMGKRKISMELKMLFNTKEMKKISQKQLLLRKQLKIIEPCLVIY